MEKRERNHSFEPSETTHSVRKRTFEFGYESSGDSLKSNKEECENMPDVNDTDTKTKNTNIVIGNGTYWLVRIVMLRFLGFIYLVAFLVAFHQNRALLGKEGLLPANIHLSNIKAHVKGNKWDMFQYSPTILWLFDYENDIDWLMDCMAVTGMIMSSIMIVVGGANIIWMLTLWILYHSIVNIGQRWYGFGWESQLLESGFLAAFFCPLLTFKALPRKTPTPMIVIWGFRWLIFRIMLGAGLIKIRGDRCWRDLTCMNYHYETQPVPNPVSYYMHQSPEIFHNFETLVNHFVELIAPFLIFLPRRCRIIGGFIQVLFQMVLIISGNLSFLNWLTILPCLACFDDASLAWMFSNGRGAAKWTVYQYQKEDKLGKGPKKTVGNYIRKVHNIGLGILLVYLSVPVVQNLWSSKQAMNTSFDPLRLVNTYGAFGSITKERKEVIFQGTQDDDPLSPKAKWLEYEFKCKPGSLSRRPCLISPYHYRLDWLMWFAAFQSYQYNNWLVHLAAKLLANDAEVVSLIETNPFDGKDPPKWIRAKHYRYTFTKIGSKQAKSGQWWKRRHLDDYLPAVSLETLKDYLKTHGWRPPRLRWKKRKNV